MTLCTIPCLVLAQPVSIEHPGLRLPEFEKMFQDEPKVNESLLAEIRSFQQQFPDSAIQIYNNLLEHSIIEGQVWTTIRVFTQLGDLYTGRGQYREALEALQNALEYSRKVSNGYFLPYIYNHFAHVYKIWGNYELAILYLYRALLANEQNPVINRSYLYNNLAIILMDIGADNSAWYYLDLGEKISRQQDNYEFIGGILLHKGSIRYQQGDLEGAMRYYREVHEITSQHNLRPLHFSVLNAMARVRLLQQRYDEAFEFLSAADVYKMHVSQVSYNSFIGLKGAAYMMAGQNAEAEHYLQMALKNAIENRIASDQMTTYNHLSIVYARTGRYDSAYQYQKYYTVLRDSLRARETTKDINRIEVRYRTVEKDKEIAYKELLLARQQNDMRIVGAVAISMVLMLAVLYIYKQRMQRSKIAALKQEEKVKSLHAFIKGEEAERRKIANDLHDGVGGLLSTSLMYLDELPSKYTVLKQAADFKEVVETVTDALEEIRKTAHSLMPELVIRYGLPHSIRLYCNKIERGGKIQVDFQCYGFDERLQPEFELSIYRIVQELMQNAVRHAEATKVLVQISAHHDILSITVEDNGVGITDNFKEGMGIATIRARVDEMQGQFSISRIQPNGTNAYLEFDLPLQKKPEV